ncbi:MAG TPA: hypothetical protein VK914_05630 [bacterium]|jgi:hypothetical protein|nr:hypothetical protein [bacterium]
MSTLAYPGDARYEPSLPASILWFLSALLFLACLYLPAELFESSKTVDQGWFFLVFGPCGLVFPSKLGLLGWLANPFYLMALLQARIRVGFVFFLFVGLALLAAFFSVPVFNTYPVPVNQVIVGGPDLMSPLAGYWLWLAAMVVLLVSGLVRAANLRDHANRMAGSIPQVAHRH